LFLALACAESMLAASCAGNTVRPEAAPGRAGPRLTALCIKATLGGAGPLAPAFSPDIDNYRLEAASTTGEILVVPAAPKDARVMVNGVPVTPGEPTTVSLAPGDNLVVVTVGGLDEEAAHYAIACHREELSPVVETFRRLSFTDPQTRMTMDYRLFVPTVAVGADSAARLPLVLFLHGAGESGRDNDAQLVSYQGAVVWARPEEQAKHSCIVLAPQNPKTKGGFALSPYGGRGWTSLLREGFAAPFAPELPLQTVYHLVKALARELPVDPDRVYATGLSMGGFGVLAMAAEHTELFAAVVSVCGGLDPARAPLLARMPLWLFHAEEDPLVSVRFSRASVDALRAAGGSPHYTEFPRGTPFVGTSAHSSWIPAYADAGMRDWLFAQHR
jgi:predicted peptidase